MKPAGETSFNAWLPVLLLWLVALLNYLDRLLITTMREPIKESIPMTDAEFGLQTSVFLWVYGLCSPLGGYLADRFNRRTVILCSLVVWSGVTWWTGRVHSCGELLMTRALMGISEACYIPAALALIADFHPGATRSLATGLHMSGLYMGAALGGVGGCLAEYYGWRFGFSFFGVFGLCYGIVLLLCLREPPRSQAVPGNDAPEGDKRGVSLAEAFGALFGQPAFWLLLVLTALVGMANWGINGWLPAYLKEHFKLGLGAAGLSATGYIQAASFLGVIGGGIWADHWGRTTPRSMALVPALGYCVAGPCLFLAAATDVLPVAILGLIVYGIGRGFFDANLMPVLRQVIDERYSATGYGFLNLISCATGGLMIYAGGMLKDAHASLSTVFQISAAGLVLAAILLFQVRPRPAPAAAVLQREKQC